MAGTKGHSGGTRAGAGRKKALVPGSEASRERLWAAIDADAKAHGGDIFQLLVKAVRDDQSFRDKVIPAWRIITDILVKGDTSKKEISIEDKRAVAPVILPERRPKPTPMATVVKLQD